MASDPQKASPPPEMLVQLADGLNPVDLWLNLHTAQGSWAQVEDKERRDSIIASNRLMLESLKDFPVARWLAFNHAIGWIPAAIAAVTWCQGAALGDCVTVWNNLAFKPAPEPGADFAARLINPAQLPELSITAISTAAASQYPAGALLIAARDEAPALDFANAEAYIRQKFPRDFAQMLVLRGAIPPEWVRPEAQAAATTPSAASPPPPPAPQAEPYYYNGTITNMLRQRKTARGWAEEEIAAALAAGAGPEITGFPYLKAFRFPAPDGARSLAADENGRVLHVGRAHYLYSDTFRATFPTDLPPMDAPEGAPPVPDSVHVPLFGEFIDVWRPVRAERLRGNIFRIVEQQETFNDEAWGMNYGPRIECEARTTGKELLLFFKRDAEARR